MSCQQDFAARSNIKTHLKLQTGFTLWLKGKHHHQLVWMVEDRVGTYILFAFFVFIFLARSPTLIWLWEGSNYPSRPCNDSNGPKGPKKKTNSTNEIYGICLPVLSSICCVKCHDQHQKIAGFIEVYWHWNWVLLHVHDYLLVDVRRVCIFFFWPRAALLGSWFPIGFGGPLAGGIALIALLIVCFSFAIASCLLVRNTFLTRTCRGISITRLTGW